MNLICYGMRRALIIILLFFWVNAFAQKEQNVWVFGYKVGLDFNSGSPVSIPSKSLSSTGCASVCDAFGRLLFYSNGWVVQDRNGALMPNGDNLMPIYLSQAQPAVIVPFPDSPGKYYLFSMGLGTVPAILPNTNLYYSVIDMNLNGGLGDVVPGRKGILIDSALTDKMTPVLGADCNIWLVVHRADTSIFKSYEITGAGLNLNPVLSKTALSSAYHHWYFDGVIKFSPNGKKLVMCDRWDENVELFDFNAHTGVISNCFKLDNDDYYGAVFSPDNSKLYVNSYAGFLNKTTSIYQFDMSSGVPATIAASKVKICTLDSDNTKPPWFTDMKIGPDGKIYLGDPDYLDIDVINKPNLAGVACDFVPWVVSLRTVPASDAGTFPACGLPNDIIVFRKDTLRYKQTLQLCFKDSILLQVDTNGSNYLWDDGSVDNKRTIYNSGIHWVAYVTPPCVHHFDTFSVSFSGRTPIIGSFNGCKGGNNGMIWSYPPTGDTTTYTYTWYNAAGTVMKTTTRRAKGDTLFNAVGNYRLDLRTTFGVCDTFISFNIPSANISFTADTATCVNDTVQFRNTSTGSYTSFLWQFGDGDTSTQFSPLHVYNIPGSYTVRLIAYPCNDTISAHVTIDSIPFVSFKPSAVNVCLGSPVIFYPSYRSGAVNLLWDFGDVNTSISSWQPMHTYDSVGRKIIAVTARYLHCPEANFKDTINVYPYPVVNLGGDTSICPGQAAITIHNLIIEPSNYTNIWNTSESASDLSVSTPGIYWLKVTSDFGCSTTDSIAVYNKCYINIPNAFTPDGDGVNDYFFPRQLLSKGVSSFYMAVYNRWGEKVFETEQVNGRGWDGKLNGVLQPEGVYIYLIKVSFMDKAGQELYKGNVTLLK
ncbi:MAG: gliding motility-associated C-terminal domain-containing protein [Bacteroidetes bacterium]|nr:gliding motility-associated C-terminal domain-containing protein [Bacteroidota bacterium]